MASEIQAGMSGVSLARASRRVPDITVCEAPGPGGCQGNARIVEPGFRRSSGARPRWPVSPQLALAAGPASSASSLKALKYV